MMRRLLLLGGLAAGLSLVAAAPAVADDLGDYLDKAAEADYAGTQVVVTVWDGASTAGVLQVERFGDTLMVGPEGREIVAGNGKTYAGTGGVVLSEWAGPHLSDRYRTSDAQPAVYLGRDAVVVTVFEGDVPRASMVFDAATWAPMSTEVYDGDGERFRYAAFTDFSPNPSRAFEKMSGSSETYEVITRIDASAMPAQAAHYARLDVYRDQDGVVQAFYGDGLFSFSVFQLAGAQGERRFAEANELRVDGSRYEVLVNPTDVWVRWMNDGTTYLLVGDLPPDHLEAVLGDLPEPSRRNLLARLWRSVFGS